MKPGGAANPILAAAGWLRRRLFATPLDAALTLLCLYLLWLIIPPVIEWGLVAATWHGASREDCGAGACWPFIGARGNQFLYGFYPRGEQWRVDAAGLYAALLVLLALLPRLPGKRVLLPLMLLALPVAAWLLLSGNVFGLEPVETRVWGGLMLTLVMAVASALVSLPLGVLLALGRRSHLKVLALIATIIIEFWRNVPIVIVILLASIFLPLMAPEGFSVDKLLAAIVGLTLVEAAYMAEVVRGGLQAVPLSQTEAAQSLGLGYWRTVGLVVLPQALRVSIPGLVNEVISLVKNTTLVQMISLFDLLGMVQLAAGSDPKWVGSRLEGYVFAGLIFWAICFGLSRYSQRLERRVGFGRRL